MANCKKRIMYSCNSNGEGELRIHYKNEIHHLFFICLFFVDFFFFLFPFLFFFLFAFFVLLVFASLCVPKNKDWKLYYTNLRFIYCKVVQYLLVSLLLIRLCKAMTARVSEARYTTSIWSLVLVWTHLTNCWSATSGSRLKISWSW